MRSRDFRRATAAALLLAMGAPLVVAAPAAATAPKPAAADPGASPPPGDTRTGAQILGAAPEPETATLERMRQEREAVLSGTHFTYDPAGRRDPFRSLVEMVAIKRESERPKGIAGMLIGEVDLVGILSTPRGEIAFLNGSDNRGYFLKAGDALFDGTVLDVDRAAGRVVFRQRVDDPREIKPYRDVIKKLNTSTEEGQ